MTLGEKLKTERRKSNYTQKKLSEELGISTYIISKWENNILVPDKYILLQISNIYNIPISTFIEENTPSDEGLFLMLLTVISCIAIPEGLLVLPLVFIRNKPSNSYHNLIYILIMISAIINLLALYDLVSHFTGIYFGETTIIERVE